MKTIHTIIIDKHLKYAHSLSDLLHQRFPNVKMHGIAETLHEALALIEKIRPDLVFLCIDFTEKNGTAIFKLLKEYEIDIVFTEVNNANAIQVLHQDVLDGLTHPITESMLKRAFTRFFTRHKILDAGNRFSFVMENAGHDPYKFGKIVIPGQKGYSFITLKDIMYVEADGNYSHIHTLTGENTLSTRTLKYFEGILPKETFYRCHKSFIINLNLVKEIVKDNGLHVVLQKDVKIHVADRNRKEFLNKVMPKGG